MYENPFMGVGFHAAGGVAHGTFYAPLKRVRAWAWEIAWVTQGFAAWILMPWFVAYLTKCHPLLALSLCSWRPIGMTFLFGAMWGAGSLTFGLSLRYLGMSLGMAIALGYTVSLGTLLPPIVAGEFPTLISTAGGRLVLLGVLTCLGGIGLCGVAGVRRDREHGANLNSGGRSSIALGFAVATFSGIMSAGFAFGIRAGQPIAKLAYENGAPAVFKNGPVFVVVMAGGFLVNFLWCFFLAVRNRTIRNLLGTTPGADSNWHGVAVHGDASVIRGALLRNYLWAGASGATWYVGFMLYGIGTTFMGRYDFTSWSIHLAFVILFSTVCGVLAREWNRVSRCTSFLVAGAMVVLVSSTFVIALGNRLAARSPSTRTQTSAAIVAADSKRP